MRESLIIKDPDQPQWKRDLGMSWNKLGEVLRDMEPYSDLHSAIQAFDEGKTLSQSLVDAFPTNLMLRRDLAVSWERLCNARRMQGDLAGALEAFNELQHVDEEIPTSDTNNPDWQRDRAIRYDRIGQIFESGENLGRRLRHIKLV